MTNILLSNYNLYVAHVNFSATATTQCPINYSSKTILHNNVKKVKDLFSHTWMKVNEIVMDKYPNVHYDSATNIFINYDGVDHCTAETKGGYYHNNIAMMATAIDILDVSEARAGFDKINVYSNEYPICYFGSPPEKYKINTSQYLLHENIYQKFQHHDHYKQERCKNFFYKRIREWICMDEQMPKEHLLFIPPEIMEQVENYYLL